MTQPLYLTYFAEESGRRWGLSIHLDAGGRAEAPSEWLRGLHAAADCWRRDHSHVFLRSDLGVEAEPDFPRAPLPGYLYASGGVNGDRLVRHLSMLHETGRIHRFVVRPGGLAEGPDLVGRAETLGRLQESLRAGSCHLRAPRRYGKSSVLRRLAEILEVEGRPCVLVDVSDGRTVPHFLLLLARAAAEAPVCRAGLAELPELRAWPIRGAGAVERAEASRELSTRIEANPWSFARRLLEALGRLAAVVVLDELSVFLRAAHARDPEEARQVASLLAESRRAAAPTRQVFAGSAGLSAYVRFHGLGPAFEDLASLDLPPLARADAAALAEELLYGEGLCASSEVVDRMLELVGEPIPYFLHVLAGAVAEASPGRSPAPETVDRAYLQRVLGDRGTHHFRIYRVSDQPYPRTLVRAASRLLRETARPEGADEAALREIFARSVPKEEAGRFEPLLACLQEDYDLVCREGRWRIRGKVLRDRWALAEPWLTDAE